MELNSESDDDADFVAILTRSQNTIELVVRALMPGERCHDEVVQQTNSKIWQKRMEFDRGTNFRAWATAIARFEVLNYRKQRARDARVKFSSELEQQIATEVAYFHDDLADRRIALQECLNQLKPESRELLLSRYGREESLAELASRVGRSVGGIKVTLCRLRTALSDCIERRLDAAEGLE